MARYKNLSGKKRDFLKELLELDKTHNFLTGPEFQWIAETLGEDRYLTSDSKWANKVFQNHKKRYFELKKN